jgi:hypothetical protein
LELEVGESFLSIMSYSFNFFYIMNAASWDPEKNSGAVPQLTGARNFTFEELKNYTNNFSGSNDIGSGGYGKVRSRPFRLCL